MRTIFRFSLRALGRFKCKHKHRASYRMKIDVSALKPSQKGNNFGEKSWLALLSFELNDSLNALKL